MYNKEKNPSMKVNFIFTILFQVFSVLCSFITAPYVSRVLTVEGIGTYSYVSSIQYYFILVSVLGTATYGAREISRIRDEKKNVSIKFWEIEILTIVTSGISTVIWVGFSFVFADYTMYCFLLLPALIASMFDISWFYTGHERIAYTVIWNAICKIIGVVCIFLFVKSKNDLVLYILLNSLVLMIGNLSMWVFLPKMLVKINPRTFELKKHFKETLIYFIPTIATTIYTVLDKTLIGAITHDNYQNGYYEQATKIINMAKTAVFVAVNSVMSARISFLFAEKRIQEIKSRIEKSMNFILLLGFAATFGIISVAKDFVPLFFGEGYEPVVGLLYWMSPLILIIGVSNCLGAQYYTPAGLRTQSSKYIITGSVINLVMNLFFIPKFAATGAVIGSIIAEMTITILYYVNCNGYLNFKALLKCCYKRLCAGIFMLIVVKFVSHCGLIGIYLLLTEIIVGAVVYFLCLGLLKDEFVEDAFLMLKRRVHKND